MNVHYATVIAPKFTARCKLARARAAKDSAQSQGHAVSVEHARPPRCIGISFEEAMRLTERHGTTEEHLHDNPNDSTQDGTDEP